MLEIIFGLIGVISFAFSVYVYYAEKAKKKIEAAKNATHLERTRNLKNNIGGLYNTIDMIIQLPKTGNITVKQLQDLARVARQQTYVLSKQVKMEEEQIASWKYGELLKSITIENEAEN